MGVLASAALLLPLLSAAPPAGAEVPEAGVLQGQFARAAAHHGVPESVLLAVSYLQSRWDTHGGAPSVTGGYGPMHLTDAVTALASAAPHHSEGEEDARGDDSRALRPAASGDRAVPAASASS
ncbi:N-acetylmuramoyl-L-alanine amidase, partial [Streptomyces sp. SR27]|nr:N-acetylmuramoyl-L-alanine amidase [Streptomyces sp. SR27]